MADHPLLDAEGDALPLPADPPSPVPDEVGAALEAHRAGDTREARTLLQAIAAGGRTAVSGHGTAALAGLELAENGPGDSFLALLGRVAAGEDPWSGPFAAVLLSENFRSLLSSGAGRALVPGLTAQLTGDLEAARNGFEEAARTHASTDTGDLAGLLLGNLLLQSADPDAAHPLLSRARKANDGLFAAYAAHLRAHLLIGRDDLDAAGADLERAKHLSLPFRSGDRGLYPWVCVRFGELLAGSAFELDLVYDQVEESGVSEGTVVREPFEAALDVTEVSRPALIAIGFHLFPYLLEFDHVHEGMERLRTWSGERYERGRRLVLALHTHVEDTREEEREQKLGVLREALDLPRPR